MHKQMPGLAGGYALHPPSRGSVGMLFYYLMNTPTHIVSGIWLAQIILHRWPAESSSRRIALGLACIAGGAVLHLAFDLLPHFAWIVYLPGFENLPFHWLIREGLATLIVAVPCLFFARANWPYVVLGMLGAIYPDVEKVAAVDFCIPDRFIMFRGHSLQLSSHDGGISHGLLILGELGLIMAMMAWTYAVARPRR